MKCGIICYYEKEVDSVKKIIIFLSKNGEKVEKLLYILSFVFLGFYIGIRQGVLLFTGFSLLTRHFFLMLSIASGVTAFIWGILYDFNCCKK